VKQVLFQSLGGKGSSAELEAHAGLLRIGRDLSHKGERDAGYDAGLFLAGIEFQALE
jgi:hypothetical protein